MEVRELTCIGCPLGCQLTVTMGNDEIKVEGNTCPRGEAFNLSFNVGVVLLGLFFGAPHRTDDTAFFLGVPDGCIVLHFGFTCFLRGINVFLYAHIIILSINLKNEYKNNIPCQDARRMI